MSTVIIAYSVNDIAGINIARNIIKLLECKPTLSVKDLNVNHSEGLSEAYICRNEVIVAGFAQRETDLEVLDKLTNHSKYIVVVSRHSAKAGKPSLTTHTPGNPWGRNDAGGRPWEIPPSNPALMWYALKELYRLSYMQGLQGFTVSYEVTHHGPTSISKPITFVELGSSEKEWTNTYAQKVVAFATVSAIEKTEQGRPNCTVTVGFGGPHYAPIFTRRAVEENECYGHIISDYVIKELTPEELRIITRKAIDLTPGCNRVVIGKMRKEVREVIEEEARSRGLEVVKYT
jgi:D-aminoacyl-tRNA deacylase